MKRIPSPGPSQTNSPQAEVKIMPNPDGNPQRGPPSEPDEETYYENYKLGVIKYWAAKAEALKQPVAFGAPVKPALPLRIDYDGIIKPAEAQKPAKYKDTESYSTLSDDAVADILKQAKPDCEKAQAWIKAHESSKIARERRRAKILEREDLRKRIFEKMRSKTLAAIKANALKKKEEEEAQEAEEKAAEEDSVELPVKEQFEIEIDEHDTEEIIWAKEASAKLQDLIFDDQGAGSESFLSKLALEEDDEEMESDEDDFVF
ncbi:hypothetical protein P175DRAFT_0493825 [Aspergillus ochraceoroseus IBT 24754]|uniref:Uncharacterized protein n=1 Tax=Aspergillus ochraceoroseus IBT 24754 TaxID=1392256 RepID=A0A2T5LUR4_9EURO|nr:uncharacterized protein P175DRAFT_0493825 [Aspergillus ochraceoroseus IBT 24754]PTU20028.1 hypothetical protein P175DRAFT_0493825 [Aspergillus ochraceoroseus IBT 24754]